MTVTGILTRTDSGWNIQDVHSGKVYELSGETFPKKAEGIQIRVIGTIEDSFGLGVLHDEAVLRVQQWRAV
jgi:hypothetical protein